MNTLQMVLTLLALAGLGLAVVLELRRAQREDRMWREITRRAALE